MNENIANFTLVVVALLSLFIVFLAIYAIGVRNELARRWESLRAKARDVAATRQRRQGVGKDVARHMKYAQRHEQRVTQSGARRGRGNGRLVGDNFNGWPNAGTTGITPQAMREDTTSRDAEINARLTLHDEAAEYNQLVRGWPVCLVARAFGFQLWRFTKHSGGRRPAGGPARRYRPRPPHHRRRQRQS